MSKTDERYSEEETARRRDEALRRALNTPPKLHSEMKAKRPKEKGVSSRGASAKGGEPSA